MVISILNGKRLDAEKASVSTSDRGFRYGDGLFETIAVHGGLPWRFDWHMDRLARGLAAVRITLDVAAVAKQCRELLAENKVSDGILRVHVTRGMGGRGYWPDKDAAPTVLIETLPLPVIPVKGGALWQSSFVKTSLSALPVTAKLSQGLNSTLARMEAADHDCLDGLQLNDKGEICETSSGNIFWLKGGTLFTPLLECGIVEGSTRAAILELSPYPVQQVRAPLAALKEAEGVFITNVVWKALAVFELQPAAWLWDSTAITEKINNILIKNTKTSA